MPTSESPQPNPLSQELSHEYTPRESARIEKVFKQIKEILDKHNIPSLDEITKEDHQKIAEEERTRLTNLSRKFQKLLNKEATWPYETLTEEYIEQRYEEITQMYESTGVTENS